MNRKTRIMALLGLFLLALFIAVPVASAYEDRSGDKVVIGADEVIDDDLFVGAQELVMNGTVNGDLIAMGQTVTINGKVTGNVIAAGSGVTVNGEVGHDVFAAGSVVTIGPDAQIAYNAYTAAGGVESQAGSQIGGSLISGAGQSLVSGEIANDLLVGGGRLLLEGTVGRNAKVAVDTSGSSYAPSFYGPNTPPMPSVPAGLTFGPDAQVEGQFEYVSDREVEGANSVSNDVKHTLPPQDEELSRELAQQNSASSYIFDALRRLIALLVIGLLVAWLAPRWITGPAETLLSRPLPSLGVGLVGLVAAPVVWVVALGVVIVIAIVFGLLSLGGLTWLTLLAGLPAMGLAFVTILFVFTYLCQAIVAYIAGRWILGRIKPEWNGNIYAPLLIGLVILGLLFAVPYAGGVIQFLIILVGLGAIILAVIQGRRAPQVPAEVPAAV